MNAYLAKLKELLSMPEQGFTLIEVMVAVSIFAIIMTVGIGALLILNNTYRQTEVERQSMDSLSYVLESMSREIRTAQSWSPTNVSGSSTFEFIDQDNLDITYQTNPLLNGRTGIEMIVKNPPQNAPVTPAIPLGTYDLTPTNVTISNTTPDGSVSFPGGGLTFNIMKGGNGLGESYVQIDIGGIVTYANRSANFSFQTGISKRVLDIP